MEESILGKRLKELREKRGYLQKYVADKIGVKSNTLSGYENGTRTPDPEIIKNLAVMYDVTIDYLFGHSDDPQGTSAKKRKEEKDVFEETLKGLPKEEQEKVKEEALAYAKYLADTRRRD